MPEMERERDLVLNPNEFAYVLDKTKGIVSCVVGSYKMSLSTSDSLVVFNKKTKKFEEAGFQNAISTFISAPENWYIELKNPAIDNKHPVAGTANILPELQIGKKINIPGNISFALYPGQMAKVIRGHRLHSNQYLLARVYDADALEDYFATTEEMQYDVHKHLPSIKSANEINAEAGENTKTPVKLPKRYTVGQILVIKGTEIPFYMPPTGIEVIPITENGTDYVREAVTLERLEYCILKDEGGNKKYIHGAAVVFPEPDEQFIINQATGGYKFRAIELSEISGIYLKVIADYNENGKKYKTGDELFITGKDQMIYYPRPEHAIIDYNGTIIHHAIAIPRGEGRYVLERKTGNIKTVVGPTMYLPDPRDEVIVKRKLTKKQCELWYPGNEEVLRYNVGLNHENTEINKEPKHALLGVGKMTKLPVEYGTGLPAKDGSVDKDVFEQVIGVGLDNIGTGVVDYPSSFFSYADPMQFASHSKSLETSAFDNSTSSNVQTEENRFTRKTTFTEPRTITFDNRFDGVVSIDIWTGYAINVVAKDGSRKVVVGPQTYLLGYDETCDILSLSTGKPKTTDNLFQTIYLRVDNNKISDIVKVQTNDFVDLSIKVSYCVDFLPDYKDKWFSIDNYVKYLTDRMRSLLKREVKLYNLEDFYNDAIDIVRNAVLKLNSDENPEESARTGRLFKENGMFIHDVEILSLTINDASVESLMNEHQINVVKKSLELTNANKSVEVAKKLAEVEKIKQTLEYENNMYHLELETKIKTESLERNEKIKRLEEESMQKEKEAEKNLQSILKIINEEQLARSKETEEQALAVRRANNELDNEMRIAYTDAIKKVIDSISPDLVAAMTSSSNAEILETVAKAMSPYAIAKDMPITDTVNKLLRGTSIENLFDRLLKNYNASVTENDAF